MPTSYLQSLSKKHNIPVAELEKYWEKAKESIPEKYEKEEQRWAVITDIFKNMINKEFNLHESQFTTFKEFFHEKTEGSK